MKRFEWTKECEHLKPGDQIRAVGVQELPNFTRGKVYTAINGYEEGIFYSDPFVTVIDDNGKTKTLHLRRFGPVE